MTATDFAAWLALMKERGLSEAACARLLGTGNNQPKRWREHGAPAYIALACAAIAYGLPAWRAQ